ncbi:MAG: hypothetical protein ACE5QW_07865 [Thermoplasmata archaeon]
MRLYRRLLSLPKHIDRMARREEVILGLFEFISQKTEGFTDPRLVTIGGYALRAYVPFPRYTRDCDFVLNKEKDWRIDEMKIWLSKKISIETLQKKDGYGYMRLVDFVQFGSDKVKISIDFMEGEVRGRTKEQVVLVDKRFVRESQRMKISIAGKGVEIFVPEYKDYLILKVISGRAGDARDIAALVWKNGWPKHIKKRAKEILPHPEIFDKNLEGIVIPDISDRRFVNSWRGTFVSTEFTEESKNNVLSKIWDALDVM